MKRIRCAYCNDIIDVCDTLYRYRGGNYCSEGCLDSEVYLEKEVRVVTEDMRLEYGEEEED